MKKKTCMALAAGLLSCAPLAGRAQEADNIYEMDLATLMSLEVSVGSNVVNELKKQPVSVTTIGRDQLMASGARTLAEAIMIYVPGFFAVEDQDDLIAGFRGLAPDNNSKVMLLVNGRNMNTEWFWGPPTALLNSTNYSYIERVEVIRGPGSVTLGQGALLGVINIVTGSGQSLEDQGRTRQSSVTALAGRDEFMGAQLDAMVLEGKTNAYFHVARQQYEGQALRNQGWAKDHANQGYLGGNVLDIGTRLKRSHNNLILGHVGHGRFDFDLLYVEQKQDLYNFYRDRNQMEQTLLSFGTTYNQELGQRASLRVSADAATDNFALSSVDGYTMGGTGENRLGAKALLNVNDLLPGNRLAVGVETRHFQFGRPNLEGNNFINNVVDQSAIDDPSAYISLANQEKVWGYRSDLTVYSFFLEDFHTLAEGYDLVMALRYDNHPFWGSNLSPRLGFLMQPHDKLRGRLTYQTGFRGAVGVHYGGGYRQDGFLSAENYEAVEAAQIAILDEAGEPVGFESNIAQAKPEKMQSLELALDYDFLPGWNFNAVGFYNNIANVIDVGVIWRDAATMAVPAVGTDVPGDWNGYWFFKNTQGEITQLGAEASLSYRSERIQAGVSHSWVSLRSAAEQQRGSMYLTAEDNFKAYPENVTRANLVATLSPSLKVGVNYLYYYRWFSPTDQSVRANHMANLTALLDLTEKFSTRVTLYNLLGQTELYPMNSNVGDDGLSDGTPSYEKTTFWMALTYRF